VCDGVCKETGVWNWPLSSTSSLVQEWVELDLLHFSYALWRARGEIVLGYNWLGIVSSVGFFVRGNEPLVSRNVGSYLIGCDDDDNNNNNNNNNNNKNNYNNDITNTNMVS